MAKITFLGAGSTIFAKNVLGDALMNPVLQDAHIALYDIDKSRLNDSKLVLDTLNKNVNNGRAKITTHHGIKSRKTALRGADFVVNAIQVGGYKPSTVIDFEVPKKYGLRQTIADTLGIGGIFRTLRTLPVMFDFAADMEEVCPDAWFLNYTNPMCMLTGAMLSYTPIKTVGLCHSVQVCVHALFKALNLLDQYDPNDTQWTIAGINHQAWLTELTHQGKDLYPEIRKLAERTVREARKDPDNKHDDLIRLDMIRHFGYYLTESSEHSAEYMPYWIKSTHPHLIEQFNIPLDEYIRRCEHQIRQWSERRKQIVENDSLDHEPSNEYGASIMAAIVSGDPFVFHGNVMNTGLITNLPYNCCVEVKCVADRNGITPTYFGDLPEQCAALNRTNINPQLMTIEAFINNSKDAVYQAAMLDPHTSAELSLDQIRDLCDDMIEAHGDMLPNFK